jgi:hypothetical protein
MGQGGSKDEIAAATTTNEKLEREAGTKELEAETKCNTQSTPGSVALAHDSPLGLLDHPHIPTWVFCAHFVSTHMHPRILPGRSPVPRLL